MDLANVYCNHGSSRVYTRCLQASLSEKSIYDAFGDIIAEQIRAEVHPLRKALPEKDKEISNLKGKVSPLVSHLECLVEYTRPGGIPSESVVSLNLKERMLWRENWISLTGL